VAEQRALDDVPFAFRYDNRVVFDRTTGRLLGTRGEGLTCASFVLAMFASLNIRLVDFASWSSRRCDTWWQARVLRAARGGHAELLRGQWGSVRFRPEEVVAAAYESARPMGFISAVAQAGGFVPHGTVGFGLLARVMGEQGGVNAVGPPVAHRHVCVASPSVSPVGSWFSEAQQKKSVAHE